MMKRSFSLLLTILLTLNSAAAVYAEDGDAVVTDSQEALVLYDTGDGSSVDPDTCEHVVVSESGKPATCMETGIMEHSYCDLCGTYWDTEGNIVESVELPTDSGNHVTSGRAEEGWGHSAELLKHFCTVECDCGTTYIDFEDFPQEIRNGNEIWCAECNVLVSYVAETPEPDVEINSNKLSGTLFGTEQWGADDPEAGDRSHNMAFDGDISTFYDAPGYSPDFHVGMEVGEPTRLTEVHIVPRNPNGYDPEVTVLDHTNGFENEEADNLFDRTLDSKWCAPGAEHSVTWETDRPVAVYGYQMYTANDTKEMGGRNPITWTLYGTNDPDGEWDIIDEQVENYDIPEENYVCYEVIFGEDVTGADGEPYFAPAPSEEYSYFKLEFEVEGITNEEGEIEYIFQLSEFRLLESEEECLRMAGMTVQGSADGENWADLYTFSGDYWAVQPYVITADDMYYVNAYSFTQFRVINKEQHFNVAEVEFYGVDGSDLESYSEAITGEHKLNTDAVIFGSEEWSEGYEFDKAFDGDTETWYDAYEHSWQDAEIGIRLGNPAKLTGINVHPRGNDHEYRLTSLAVQGSVNGNDWITLYQFDDVQDYEYRYYEISEEMLASAAHDYAFTQFRVMNKAEHLNVAEVEFYGTYDHGLETFPTEFDEPIYSYLTAEQFLDTAWVYYERNPENPDDDHSMDWWYFIDRGESGEEMTRFEQEFANRNPIILIGGVGFDETVLNIQDIDGQPIIAVAPHAFSNESGIVEVIVNEFSECKYIMGAAFAECYNIETVTVSNSLREVYTDTFNCGALREFIKADGDLSEEEKNERDWGFVEVVNGALISRADVLIKYPPQAEYVESYTVPDYIHHIANWAFAGAQIGEITMGHNVLRVNYGAFSGCAAHTIELSPALQYLGNHAFAGCTNLTSVRIPSDRVEIDCWENDEGETEYVDDMFADTVDYENGDTSATRTPITVVSYKGGMIDAYINYINDLSEEDTEDDYDMSHVKFESETETYWYGFDWWGECGENEVFLVGYSAPLNAEITTMPTETYDGKTIIGVGCRDDWRAFCGDDRVRGTFTVPEGIRYLHGRPFAECNNLTVLVLPASLEKVDALNDRVPNLEKFEVSPDSEHFYTADNGASLYSGDTYVSFAPGSGLEEIEILSGTRLIDYSAFENVKGIKTVTVPESVEFVENWAFQNSSLESITLPRNVNYIGENAFADCPNLTTVTINSLSDDFSIEGNVFANSYPTIYVYAGTCAAETMLEGSEQYGWTVVVNEIAETIYDTYTENDGVHLRKVYVAPGATEFEIPEDVQVIDDRAFKGITGITKVVFPENLRYIGHEVFTGCAENFTAEFKGAVELHQEDDSFDNGFRLNVYPDDYADYDENGNLTGLFYRLNPSTKEAMVNAWYYNAVDDNGVLTVPETIDVDGEEYTVVAVETEALAGYIPDIVRDNAESIELPDPDAVWAYPKSIVLPDTIRYIGSGAMGSQTYDVWTGEEYGLTHIKLPKNVQYIAEDFVFACWNIQSYTGLADWGDETSDAPYRLAYGQNENGEAIAVVVNTWNEQVLHAYPQGNAADEFVMPAGIEVIGRNAVRDAQNLTRVNLTAGNSLYRIADQAFCNCGNLERVMIPASLRNIEHGPFTECHSLVAFDIPNENPTFAMHDDGTLRMGDEGEIIAVLPFGNIPEDGVYRISDDVREIKDGAARGSRNLTELIIPASVSSIYDWAFSDSQNLRKVTIEGTLDYFSIDTFAWARNLEEIVYCGDRLDLFYHRNDDIDNFYVRIRYDENGDEVFENDRHVREKFDLICMNENCEVNFFLLDDYDYENGNREDLNANDNEFFTLTHKSGPVYETYTNEEGVHLSRVYNVSGDVVIPPEVMIIDDGVFADIKGIDSVTFPKNLHYIGFEAFKGCGEFEVHFTGAVQIGSEGDSFDFDFGAVYGEAFFGNQHWDGKYLYYVMPEVKEVMLRGYWYTAIDQNTGEMVIPSTTEIDGETYTVAAIEPGSCEAGSAERLGGHVRDHAEEMGWSIEEREEWTYDYPKSVIIPNTVRYIGYGAFQGHGYWNEEDGDYGLESVTLPAELAFLPCDAFWDCYQIKAFNGLDDFRSGSENPYQLYAGSVINTWGSNGANDILMLYPPECGNTEYTVPGDIEIIGENAFRWAAELTTLTLEEGVRVLREHAVIVTGLETLTIPNSLEEIHANALAYNQNMKTFIVNDHPWLSVHEDNTLRMEGGEKLVAYPTGTIENGVLEITAESGIRGISNIGMAGIGIQKLVLSEQVEQIDDWAFTNNDDLKTVIINGTIDMMNLDVFADCDNMETIIYNGEYINVFCYDGDNFTIAHEYDDYGTPRKIDFIMPDNTDSIRFFVAYDYDINNRKEGVHTPADNPYFNLLSEEPEVLLGDISGDGKVDTFDRMTLARTLAEWPDYPMEDLDPAAADINGDGSIDTFDRMILARYLAEWPGYETLEQFRQ